MSGFAVKKAVDLDTGAQDRRWLVEGLWADEAVGIVGGEPKCCKSFLALDLAVAVASGAPCLRRFRVANPGRVLLFAAEDPPHMVRHRLEGIARAAGVAFESLEVFAITTPAIRLDDSLHRERLHNTVEAVRPRLLVLDPFARLHGSVDENAAAEVAPVLAYLRTLQRRFHTAVLLVHHARKGAAHTRAGQALRGSSEFHGWGNSNLYLRRKGKELRLSIEHRDAPSTEDLRLALKPDGEALALEVLQETDATQDSPLLAPKDRVTHALAGAHAPLPLRELRTACRMRTERLCETLRSMTAEGLVVKSNDGYRLNAR